MRKYFKKIITGFLALTLVVSMVYRSSIQTANAITVVTEVVTSSFTTPGSGANAGQTSTITSPDANTVYIIAAYYPPTIGAYSNITASGLNMTWTRINEVDAAATASEHLAVFWGIGASPTTGTITLTPGVTGAAAKTVRYQVIKLSGVDTTSPIVQNSAANSGTSPLTVTLSAFSNVNNATMGYWGNNAVLTTKATYTALTASTDSSVAWLQGQYKLANDTTPNETFSSAPTLGAMAIAFELKVSTATTFAPWQFGDF